MLKLSGHAKMIEICKITKTKHSNKYTVQPLWLSSKIEKISYDFWRTRGRMIAAMVILRERGEKARPRKGVCYLKSAHADFK
jgi:hypothetical protein